MLMASFLVAIIAQVALPAEACCEKIGEVRFLYICLTSSVTYSLTSLHFFFFFFFFFFTFLSGF